MQIQKTTWWVLAVGPLWLLATGDSFVLAAEQAGGEHTIAFRLAQWKSMHFDDAKLAKQHLATVQQLGCEARQESHNGHLDVAYRCAAWRPLTVGSEELAHQWQAWLGKAGFETLHGHNAAGGPPHSHASHQQVPREVVAYRLSRSTTKHFGNPDEADQIAAILKAFGCDVAKGKHGDHVDVSIQCADWMQAEFASHAAAHGWQKWLEEIGFETRHSH